MFGSSNLIEQPKSVRKSFIYRKKNLDQNHKFICQTKNIDYHQIFIHGVDPCDNYIFDNTYLKLNHYVIQSYNFFKYNKMIKGDADNTKYEKKRTIEFFKDIDNQCLELDLGLYNLVKNKNINCLLKKIDISIINNILNNIDLSKNIYQVYFSHNNKELSYLLNELLYNNKLYVYNCDNLDIDYIKCNILDYDLINQCSTIIIHGEGIINLDKIKTKIINI
jgi:hypothetical protein